MSAARHNAMVGWLLAFDISDLDRPEVPLEVGVFETRRAFDLHFPDATNEEFRRALIDAGGICDEEALVSSAIADVLNHFLPLCEGFAPDLPLEECARIKAVRGDALALEFMGLLEGDA